MKVIVAVNPFFPDYGMLESRLDSLLSGQNSIEIVCGDVLSPCVQYALDRGYPFRIFETDERLEPAAGTIRNILMAGYADMMICFGGISRELVDDMLKRNKPVRMAH